MLLRVGPPSAPTQATGQRQPEGDAVTDDDRLSAQLEFVLEIDRLKQVVRQTYLTDRSRRETDAEHSWHVAVMALVLGEYAAGPGVNLDRAVRLLLVHDLVEIDAGDTFVYDEAGRRDQAERERRAADRIFGLLPADQGATLRGLWEEYESRQTPEARFAGALDRFQPILHNVRTKGAAWQAHGIRRDQVVAQNRHMAEGAPALWRVAERLIDDAVAQGYLAP